jgi:potassium channel subfamily K
MVLFGGLWTNKFLFAPNNRREHHQYPNGEHSSHESGPYQHSNNGYGTLPVIDHDAPSLTEQFEGVDADWSVLRLCALYTLSYIVLAIIAFSFIFEHWTIIDSIYFATSTFTTVGYGDLEPTTEGGQLFTIFFATYGVIILGIFIGIVGHAISEGQSKAIQKLHRSKTKRLLKMMFRRHSYESTLSQQSTASTSSDSSSFFSDHATLFQDVIQVCRVELPEILVVVFLAWILGLREGWSFTSTMYFCIMSASTTGFGDYTPKSQVDKVYCIFYLPLSVAVFGEVLGRIASLYINRRRRRAEQAFLKRCITMCDLRRMDANRDGQVDREEFVCYMLVALQKVDQSTIDELKDIFHVLDRNDNGMLEKDDLVEITQSSTMSELQTLTASATAAR